MRSRTGRAPLCRVERCPEERASPAIDGRVPARAVGGADRASTGWREWRGIVASITKAKAGELNCATRWRRSGRRLPGSRSGSTSSLRLAGARIGWSPPRGTRRYPRRPIKVRPVMRVGFGRLRLIDEAWPALDESQPGAGGTGCAFGNVSGSRWPVHGCISIMGDASDVTREIW